MTPVFHTGEQTLNKVIAGLILLCGSLAFTSVVIADDMRIYEPGVLTRDRYEIVSRLWVESWRSAFQVPTHADPRDAIGALKAEAAQRGANALTNVACLKDDAPFPGGAPHFCYALAIRVK